MAEILQAATGSVAMDSVSVLLLLLLFPSFMSLLPLYEDIMVWIYQLSMVEEDPRCPCGQFSGRTTDVLQASSG
jgi:hypothetical protein